MEQGERSAQSLQLAVPGHSVDWGQAGTGCKVGLLALLVLGGFWGLLLASENMTKTLQCFLSFDRKAVLHPAFF